MARIYGVAGRKSFDITQEILTKLEDFASRLYSKTQIGAALGVSLDTVIRKMKESADFAAAYERGRALGLAIEAEKIDEVKEALFKNATTMALNDKGMEVGPQGGDTKAQMFILRARAGWTDQKVEISGDPDKPILIAPLFAENYQKSLDKFTKVIDAPASDS